MPKLVHPNLPGREIEVPEKGVAIRERSGWRRAGQEDGSVDLDGMSREELDTHAATVGVAGATSLPNKQAVKEAIHETSSASEPDTTTKRD